MGFWKKRLGVPPLLLVFFPHLLQNSLGVPNSVRFTESENTEQETCFR